ncbi:MAG: homoserine kinase [Deltaproteobacteria bacterium CG_4_10_14_0_2_um_filter_43_8]|nr:MAG: homoserine kinase [Deltaproteobacteria bacterium CG11_big_fil_rev_8_21_14_0_20_42_23]PJA21061.1 MAG: homoserine kinase [Deltaproteobacteria bacterium CG_4_10_14_0_2_um_filter_43_8]PJC64243.1 MAG: homoserine kinase [Deltaproteobacteria bacterium CG_4_9_14_0_2_um_filter_42_21]
MKKNKSIIAYAPASIANVGPGFDCLGLAVHGLGDLVKAELIEGSSLRISNMSGKSDGIPLVAAKNTASVAVKALLKHIGVKIGIALEIEKGIPAGSGLGSSAASSAAAVFAVSELLNLKISKEDLVVFAAEGEKASSGVAHADNVAPSLLGGFTIASLQKKTIKIKAPQQLTMVLVKPHMTLETKKSRAVLPKTISLSDCSRQGSYIAGLVAGMCLRNFSLIQDFLQDDIVEPARKKLIPHFTFIKALALEHGALACSIAGAGPALFVLAEGNGQASHVARILEKELKNKKPGFDIWISRIDNQGARILHQ